MRVQRAVTRRAGERFAGSIADVFEGQRMSKMFAKAEIDQVESMGFSPQTEKKIFNEKKLFDEENIFLFTNCPVSDRGG